VDVECKARISESEVLALHTSCPDFKLFFFMIKTCFFCLFYEFGGEQLASIDASGVMN